MLYKLYESYLDLWAALFNNILNQYKKAIEDIKNEYQYAFLLGYSDGYKEGLREAQE
jgi:hypothetical protein